MKVLIKLYSNKKIMVWGGGGGGGGAGAVDHPNGPPSLQTDYDYWVKIINRILLCFNQIYIERAKISFG